MATVKPPENEKAPFCKCGCGERVNWGPGKGWSSYCKGHHLRGKPGTRLGAITPKATRKRQVEAARLREVRKRRQQIATALYCPPELAPDRHEVLKALGVSIYTTSNYRIAREELVKGKPCLLCGSTEGMHAHHVIPGDDDTLIPLCNKCHPTVHAKPGAKGQLPPPNEQPPACACGCGLPVSWKRVRGWAKYRKGHGSAKVPAGTRDQDAPLCKCGCGEQISFRYGHGWNEYKQGHRQRIEGHYRDKAGTRLKVPLCACGCGQKTKKKYGGYPKYIPGHRKITKGRKPPPGEQAPKCACGCGGDCGWTWGHGWGKWIRNHDKRGKSRKAG